MSNKIVLAGGSGFIGGHLIAHLVRSGREVVVLSRSGGGSGEGWRTVKWDGESVGEWAKELEGAEAVINLSGASISKKWTEEYKKVLRDSRVKPTTAIGQAIFGCKVAPKVWLNASAIGIYGGDAGERNCTEATPAAGDFLGQLCVAWEDAAKAYESGGTRLVFPRIGLVLGRDGGMLSVLKKLTAAYLGGAAGDGKQWMSWVHVDDLCRMFLWMLDEEVRGAVNVVAPEPVRNGEFMGAMRSEMGRPPVPGVPSFMMELVGPVIGMETSLVLGGQKVFPVIASGRGFEFEYRELERALDNLLGEKAGV